VWNVCVLASLRLGARQRCIAAFINLRDAIIALCRQPPGVAVQVIVDKQLMDELVGAIKSQSSCSEALMKVATCLTLMHASNEVRGRR
jgi:hypothetical protein